MTTSTQAVDRIFDAVAALTATLGDAHPDARLAILEPALHRLDRAVSRARSLILLTADLRLNDPVPETYFDPIDEVDHLLALEELRCQAAGPLEPLAVQVVVDGGSTVLGAGLARSIAGARIARPVDGRIELDLTREVARAVEDFSLAPDAVLEDALDVVDDDDEEYEDEEARSESDALATLRRRASGRW